METVLRVVFVYGFLLIALRLMGKREFGEMSPSDFLVLVFIPDIFQQALVGDDFSMTNAVVAVTTLLALVFTTATLTYRYRKVDQLVEGGPTVLLAHGRMIGDALALERLAPEHVMEALHEAGYDRPEKIRWAILEADGQISVIPKGQPVVNRRENSRRSD